MDCYEEVMKCLKEIKGNWFEETDDLILGGIISSFELLKLVKLLEVSMNIKIPLEKIEPTSFNSIISICELIRGIKND